MNQEHLRLLNLQVYRRGRPLANPLTLNLDPGTVLGVVGPNGVGKSSLLAAIASAGVQVSGSVQLGDIALTSVSARARATRLAMLSQDVVAPDELVVHEIVAVGAHAGRRNDIEASVTAALERLDIGDLAHARYGTLSGGQRQLTHLARVLAQNTPVIVLDEPTSALDLGHQRSIEQLMRELGNEGRIVIAALHDLSLALNACTRVLLLDQQGEHHAGKPTEVFRADLLRVVYGVETSIHTAPNGRTFLIS